MNAYRPIKRPKNVLLDSSLFGQVLVSGGHILSFLASLARDGKVSLFMPWIVVQEVLSNVPKWTKERIYPHIDDNVRRELRKCDLDPKITEESDAAARKAFEKTCAEITSRFKEWCKQSMCETLPLTLEQCKATWENYFSGGPPFDTKKNKEHIPDAHIFQTIRVFVEAHGQCAFISSDNNLGESVGALEGVEVFKTPSELFDVLGLSTTFKEARASHPKLKGISLSDEQIKKCIHDGLLNRQISMDGTEWAIEEVTISASSTRQQSSTPLLDSNLLVGITAKVDLKLISTTKTATEIISQSATSSIEMEGGIVVNAESLSAELDEFSFLTPLIISEEKQNTSPCDAVVNIESYYQRSCKATLAEMPPGLILVTGGNIKERRKMAEWLCATLHEERNKHDYALRLFPLHEPLPNVHEHKLNDIELYKFIKRQSADIVAVEESASCDMEDATLAAAHNRNTFVIFAVGTCTGTDALVRAVADVDIGMDSLSLLEGVVNFTKRGKKGATFNFHNRSQWAGPRWDATLMRDEWMRPKQRDKSE